MADFGSLLGQLMSNNPIAAYAQGAQIRATLDNINNSIAAQTFENNLNTIKLAQAQFQNQFQNQLSAQDLAVHVQNAQTQRMFAQNELNPNSLQNQYKRAQIYHLMNGGAGGQAADEFVRSIGGSPGTSSQPSAASGQPSFSANGGYPTDANGQPIFPTVASNQTVSATGGPGVLPALPGLAASVATSGGQVPVTPQIAGAVATDPAIAAETKKATAAGLQMAQLHQSTYDRSYEDTLAIDPTSDTAPSPEEIESAQRIKQYSDALQGGSPSQAPAPSSAPAPIAAGAPAAGAQQKQTPEPSHESPLVQEAKLKALVEAYKGAPAKLKSDPRAIQANVNNMAALAAIKLDPAYHEAVAKAYPSQKTLDGKTYELKRWVEGENGMKNPEYVQKNGDGKLQTQTLTDEKGTPVQIMTTTPDGKQHFSALPKATAPAIPEAKTIVSKAQDDKLTALKEQAALNPDNEADKIKGYELKYGKGSFSKSDDNWKKAYDATVEVKKTALADLQKSLLALRKSGHVIDTKYLPFLPNPDAMPDVSTASDSSGTKALPKNLQGIYGG